MNDTWIERPFVPGVVLVGDAAGWSDPLLGQGLSIAFRDARVLTDALLADDNWAEPTFVSYADERAERMRRLRFAYAVMALFDQLDAHPDERARRRTRMTELLMAEPELARCRAVAALGPWRCPPEAFEPSVLTALAMA